MKILNQSNKSNIMGCAKVSECC